jgi:hypothetical protein
MKDKKKLRSATIVVRVTPLEKVRIKMLANRFMNGKLSNWMRHAALGLNPKGKPKR